MNFSSGNPASAPDIAEMVARRAVGYSLEAPFYTSQEVYDLDLDAIFGKHWLFACTEAELAEPGDYVTLDIGRQSIIIVRDDDETVRALRNVCRHRGSRILQDACGSVGNLVCPYHQWTYRTDGSLIHAEGQDPALDRKQFGLKPVSVRTVAGLVMVCLSDEPPADIDEVAAVIEPYLAPYRLQDAKVAHQIDLIEEGNWKLVVENNRECQHCDAGHPELLTAYFPVGLYAGGDYPRGCVPFSSVTRPPRLVCTPPARRPACRSARIASSTAGPPDTRSPTCRSTAPASPSERRGRRSAAS